MISPGFPGIKGSPTPMKSLAGKEPFPQMFESRCAALRQIHQEASNRMKPALIVTICTQIWTVSPVSSASA